MKIPESMRCELQSWNGGEGINLESWVGCEGNYSLAIGYLEIFWPEFLEFEGYVLRKNFSEESLRSFELSLGGNRSAVEAVMNHLHISSLHYYGCADLTKDKVVILGQSLSEIYASKLKWQFPSRDFKIEFYTPENEDNLEEYQITFWQERNA